MPLTLGWRAYPVKDTMHIGAVLRTLRMLDAL